MYQIVYTNRMKKDVKHFLMYQIFEDCLILSVTATGTHSDLFGE